MPEYQLVIVDGPDQGREFSVSGAAVIGRDPSAGIVLSDTEASRRHATVMIQEGREGLLVEDLGSTNGSFLNGQKIIETHDVVPAKPQRFKVPKGIFEKGAYNALVIRIDGTVAPRGLTAAPVFAGYFDEVKMERPWQMMAREPADPIECLACTTLPPFAFTAATAMSSRPSAFR